MQLAGLSRYYTRKKVFRDEGSTVLLMHATSIHLSTKQNPAQKNNPFLCTHIRKVKVWREEVLTHQHTRWTKQLFGLLKVWTAGAFRHKSSAEHPRRRCSKSCLDQNRMHFHSCPVSSTDPTTEHSPVSLNTIYTSMKQVKRRLRKCHIRHTKARARL